MTHLKLLIIIILLSLILNVIFIFNKTVYTLVTSILIFLFVSMFMIFLDFEFLALAFAMVYIGGIAVMFLFLILVVDVRVENTKNIFFTNNSYISANVLTIFFSFLLSSIYLIFFDPFLFNSIYFQDILLDNFDLIINKRVYFDFDELNYMYICDFNDFSDLFILGVHFFKFKSILLLLISFYLFVATIVSIALCTNIFKYDIE